MDNIIFDQLIHLAKRKLCEYDDLLNIPMSTTGKTKLIIIVNEFFSNCPVVVGSCFFETDFMLAVFLQIGIFGGI